MPRESVIPGSPSDWLRRARSDLALAKMPLPDGALYEDLCFHAQQAGRKSDQISLPLPGLRIPLHPR
jgi:HEPN domain-containing protein